MRLRCLNRAADWRWIIPLFVSVFEGRAQTFSERAKQFDLLLVPGSGFGAPGHVRVAYCVQPETIQCALPKFKALADSYK